MDNPDQELTCIPHWDTPYPEKGKRHYVEENQGFVHSAAQVLGDANQLRIDYPLCRQAIESFKTGYLGTRSRNAYYSRNSEGKIKATTSNQPFFNYNDQTIHDPENQPPFTTVYTLTGLRNCISVELRVDTSNPDSLTGIDSDEIGLKYRPYFSFAGTKPYTGTDVLTTDGMYNIERTYTQSSSNRLGKIAHTMLANHLRLV